MFRCISLVSFPDLLHKRFTHDEPLNAVPEPAFGRPAPILGVSMPRSTGLLPEDSNELTL